MKKPRVVVFVEYYLPGFRAGGPIRSISALVEQLGHEIEFFVVTRDRDAGGDAPYHGVQARTWESIGKGKVQYLGPDEMSPRHLAAVARDVQPHAIYLNSFFAPMSLRLLLARRLGALRGIPILLAPRGELSPGALALKAFKKRILVQVSHWTGLHRAVVFHASTERESDEIVRALSTREAPRVARNPVSVRPPTDHVSAKMSGIARFVFLSRISRKKNLHFAIDLLRCLRGSVEFDVYGPVIGSADELYWRCCQAQIAQMPPNVTVTYRGPVAHELVASTLSARHFFLFPTASENFGHAIVEALSVGCPIITSDQTPWRGIAQRGAGWDLRLDDTDAWRRVLQTCVDMDGDTYSRSSLDAKALGNEIAAADTVAENRRLFRSMFKNDRGVWNGPEVSVA